METHTIEHYLFYCKPHKIFRTEVEQRHNKINLPIGSHWKTYHFLSILWSYIFLNHKLCNLWKMYIYWKRTRNGPKMGQDSRVPQNRHMKYSSYEILILWNTHLMKYASYEICILWNTHLMKYSSYEICI